MSTELFTTYFPSLAHSIIYYHHDLAARNIFKSSFKFRCGDRVIKSVKNKLAVARMYLPCSRVIMQYAANRSLFFFSLKPILK